MPDVTFKNISPLIVSQSVEHSSLHVTFRCPVTGESVESTGTLRRERGVAAAAKKSFVRNLRWMASRAVRSAVGHNIAGRVAGDVAHEATRGLTQSVEYGEKEKEAAAVDAFKRVASRFSWDEAGMRWVLNT